MTNNEEKYYYYVYSCRNIDDRELLYVDGVYNGNIAELILKLKREEMYDHRYRYYILTFYKEITKEEYVKLNGEVG